MSSASDARAPILLCRNPGETTQRDRTCLSGWWGGGGPGTPQQSSEHTTRRTINRLTWIVARTISQWLLSSYWVLYWACDRSWPAVTTMMRQLFITTMFLLKREKIDFWEVLTWCSFQGTKKLVVSLAIYRCSRLGCNSDKGNCGVCYLLFRATQVRRLTAQSLSPPLGKRCWFSSVHITKLMCLLTFDCSRLRCLACCCVAIHCTPRSTNCHRVQHTDWSLCGGSWAEGSSSISYKNLFACSLEWCNFVQWLANCRGLLLVEMIEPRHVFECLFWMMPTVHVSDIWMIWKYCRVCSDYVLLVCLTTFF